MAIGLSHGGTNVYSAGERSNQLWVATQDGLVLFERAGIGQWREAQRALRGQHISAIIFEKTTGTMLAGAFFGSIHASTDGGKTWERRDNGMPIHDVYSLASHVIDGKVRVYAGTQPAHLFVSEDLGMHWRELPSMREVPSATQWSFPAPPHIAHTKFITFDPFDQNVLYACVEQGAFLKSSDLGKSWRQLNTVRWNISTMFTAASSTRANPITFTSPAAPVCTSPTTAAAVGSVGRRRIGRPTSILTVSLGIRKIPT